MTGSSGTSDELWTVGEAAAYLNAAGVNLGFSAQRVRQMIERGDLVGVQTQPGGWRRTPASGIRALRATMLAALNQDDPDTPGPAV